MAAGAPRRILHPLYPARIGKSKKESCDGGSKVVTVYNRRNSFLYCKVSFRKLITSETQKSSLLTIPNHLSQDNV